MFERTKRKNMLRKFNENLRMYKINADGIPDAIKDKIAEKAHYFVQKEGNEFDLFIWFASEMVLFLQRRPAELAAFKHGNKEFWTLRARDNFEFSNCKADKEAAFVAMAYTRIMNKNLKM